MKELRLTIYALFSCLLILSCSNDNSDLNSTDETIVTDQQIESRTNAQQPYTIYIQWASGVDKRQRNEIRKFYEQYDYSTNTYPVENGYLIDWEPCPNSRMVERWIVNHCFGCKPFHDPGDNSRIATTTFSGFNPDCGLLEVLE